MHNHSDQNETMMWIMVLCCTMPIILILLGTGGLALDIPKWVILGGIAVILIGYMFIKISHKSDDCCEKKDEGHDSSH